MVKKDVKYNSPVLSLLKFLPLTYHHSHFLAATLDFTSFFTIAFLRTALLFLQRGCFRLYVTLFWKTIHLGTLANFVFYSYNEALSGYLPCVKIL